MITKLTPLGGKVDYKSLNICVELSVIMAGIQADCMCVPNEYQIKLVDGWLLDIDITCRPVKYTLIHGKKSLCFYSEVMKNLVERNYSLRLVKGRRQMILPARILQEFETCRDVLCLYDADLTPQP